MTLTTSQHDESPYSRSIWSERLTYDQAKASLEFCDSYSRLPVLLDLHLKVEDADWLRLLGNEWSSCDNIGEFYSAGELDDTPLIDFDHGYIKPEMMSVDEQAFYDSLPDTFVVYRGCHKFNKWGLSWSLFEDIAESFPNLNRYRHECYQALLVKATAQKSKVIAVKLDRNEFEIIIERPKQISIRHAQVVKRKMGTRKWEGFQ